MSQAITVPNKTINDIFTRLDELTNAVKKISLRLFEDEPLYGSDEWWKRSDKKAIEEIKAGKGVKFNTVQDAIKWLNS